MAITSKINTGKWVTHKSAVPGYLKKPKGFEAWFYTGPSLNFGHVQKPKKSS